MDIKDCEERCKEKDLQIEQLTNEVERLTEENTELLALNKALMHNNRDEIKRIITRQITATLSMVDDNLQDLKQNYVNKIKEYQEQEEGHIQKIKEHEQREDLQKKRIADLEGKIDVLQQENLRLVQANSALQRRVEDLEFGNKARDDKITSLENDNKTQGDELKSVTTRLGKLEESYNKSLIAAKKQAEYEVTQTYQEQTKKIGQLEKENKELKEFADTNKGSTIINSIIHMDAALDYYLRYVLMPEVNIKIKNGEGKGRTKEYIWDTTFIDEKRPLSDDHFGRKNNYLSGLSATDIAFNIHSINLHVLSRLIARERDINAHPTVDAGFFKTLKKLLANGPVQAKLGYDIGAVNAMISSISLYRNRTGQ
ncbi:hypothetical protein DFA_03737 [Cavenderia fasciculata]|uniref:Uncharacterized protein n=1 Tax=Cavenderia fasciculata TaxID=261658 RepID=F4Q099_CACFS|nr:uncharacterized protein DFA_03737 [Cavenderia fasciculata]EGG18250.1 hypothetical protein DFA_03737 [Cavenderia fasciculata]|eukprot:XP_004357073.1 hypothetical protein DFA_03737 [Cavenderia fasciculata]